MVGKWRMKVANDFVVINTLIEVLKFWCVKTYCLWYIYIYTSQALSLYVHDSAGLSVKILEEIDWKISFVGIFFGYWWNDVKPTERSWYSYKYHFITTK